MAQDTLHLIMVTGGLIWPSMVSEFRVPNNDSDCRETNSRFQRTTQISSSMRTKNKLTVLIDYRTFSRFVKIFTYKKRYTFRRITSTFNGKKCATSRKRVDSSARFSSFTKHFQIGIKNASYQTVGCVMNLETRRKKGHFSRYVMWLIAILSYGEL